MIWLLIAVAIAGIATGMIALAGWFIFMGALTDDEEYLDP